MFQAPLTVLGLAALTYLPNSPVIEPPFQVTLGRPAATPPEEEPDVWDQKMRASLRNLCFVLGCVIPAASPDQTLETMVWDWIITYELHGVRTDFTPAELGDALTLVNQMLTDTQNDPGVLPVLLRDQFLGTLANIRDDLLNGATP